MKTYLFPLFFLILLLSGCAEQKKPEQNGAFAETKEEENLDLEQLHESGELIAGTLSGPETYFVYQGKPLGKQYALAEDFARKEGLRLRMETARDEDELKRMLLDGSIDIIAMQCPDKETDTEMLAAGASNDSLATSWLVRKDAEALANALNEWFDAGVELSVTKQEANKLRNRQQVRRKMRAPYISKEKGIISTYDVHFKSAAKLTGWDWRLIAAQCYQESGFDPNATSWAGARGLMQIMPGTARDLNLPEDRICVPADNIAAAARYIKLLNEKFSDISDPRQRICFVLAAYNGGHGHIRDAMALATKNGRNPRRWQEVSPYVLGLSEARFYRDPVVKNGYMIGSETVGYVSAVLARWQAYGGESLGISTGETSLPASVSPTRRQKTNRFTKGTKILRPEELSQESVSKP